MTTSLFCRVVVRYFSHAAGKGEGHFFCLHRYIRIWHTGVYQMSTSGKGLGGDGTSVFARSHRKRADKFLTVYGYASAGVVSEKTATGSSDAHTGRMDACENHNHIYCIIFYATSLLIFVTVKHYYCFVKFTFDIR